MHELSLAEGVVRIVLDSAKAESFTRVRRLRLSASKLSGVEIPALRFALEAIVPGTPLDGARIQIDEPPGCAWCFNCNANIEVASRLDACPRCGGHRYRASEEGLRVVELEVD
ncbi:MAG: hydrogenase maturation nickel metallochaperone HypA [Rhodanobacter sp.]|jgi:hydrogenase nickel incorporation protein HypA/HybF|nr:hydrogenase maturation nickel metallochaperone HypA [Rhodanobacter sp.]